MKIGRFEIRLCDKPVRVRKINTQISAKCGLPNYSSFEVSFSATETVTSSSEKERLEDEALRWKEAIESVKTAMLDASNKFKRPVAATFADNVTEAIRLKTEAKAKEEAK